MNKPLFRYFVGASLVISGSACKEIYNPPQGQTAYNYLVVDGFLDRTQPTTITLSRTRSLADTTPSVPELNARVTVEGDGSNIFPLTETGKGNYSIAALPMNPSEKYRLNIITANGENFISDYVEVKQTPPIDSISFTKQDDGAHIYANTHDPLNNSTYYKWEFSETWEYHSFFVSELEYSAAVQDVVARPIEHQIWRCWRTTNSTSIFIGSTANLSQDVIFEYPLVTIPTADVKLGVLYSIWVKQHVLTKEAYEFWQNLRKNTEELGSLFDAQPFQVTGNIHSVTNPSEPVIGFVSAGSSDTSRIYIYETQVDPWGYTLGLSCQKNVVKENYAVIFSDTTSVIPVDYYYVQGLVAGVYGADGPCVDCRQKGGTTFKPVNWPR